MQNYPNNSEETKGIDVVQKAKTCKSELSEKYPELTIYRRTKRYMGGCSFTIYTIGETTEEQRETIQNIVNKYQFYYDDHNPQFDYFHVDNYSFVKFYKSKPSWL